MDFSSVASNYAGNVQIPAGERLLQLLKIQDHEDVLDLGCGNGKLTAKIRALTRGRVVGIDASERMIDLARKYEGIEFYVLRAEDMDFHEEFDVILCNSAFQWFDPHVVLPKCYKALRDGGRMGVQAPAKKIYSPNFVEAFERVQEEIDTFRSFRCPWFFLDSEEEYKRLFESYGFKVDHCKIERFESYHTPKDVFNIFMTGASVGYLNPRYYDEDINKYVQNAKRIIMRSFEEQAENGLVKLIFNRVFVIARKH
ncbi:class I SAM-dependent methyltransferase [Archaeoglobus sp.]